MNKLCVVTRNSETYFVKRLTAKVGEAVIWNPWGSDPFPPAKNYLIRTTGVYGDDLDLELLRKAKNYVINPVSSHEILRDKSVQFSFLEKRGFHLIPWRTLDKRDDFLPEKILIKPIRGQGGWGIKIMAPEEFLEWEQITTDRSWILQPFIEGVREFRLFFTMSEEILLERTGDITANFRRGGNAKIASMNSELHDMADEIRNLIGLSYGAIDFFVKGREILILEINPVPGIEQLEKVTGEDILSKIISHLKV